MKGKINNRRKLGMWLTYDQIEPGRMILWELNMREDENDLLLYDKNVPVEKVEKDIKHYYGKSVTELGWALRTLSSDEVYSTYLSG